MMYLDKFVVAIKADGKVLRETKDLVQLPFGSEFSVLVKNLNSCRAKFRLHIDGTDVLDSTEIIVNAHSEVEMKRFIRNGNMSEGNAFKFIERTQSIEDGPRGIKVDDGIVRVEFWFEKAPAEVVNHIHHYHDKHYWYDNYRFGNHRVGDQPYYGAVGSTYSANGVSANVSASSTKGILRDAGLTPQNVATSEVGITVPGSKVEQQFSTVYGFNAEAASNVIVLRIAGKVGTVEVAVPLTVKTQLTCVTCAKVNKSSSKFCSECGTSLMII